jgi:hypothetical protein
MNKNRMTLHIFPFRSWIFLGTEMIMMMIPICTAWLLWPSSSSFSPLNTAFRSEPNARFTVQTHSISQRLWSTHDSSTLSSTSSSSSSASTKGGVDGNPVTVVGVVAPLEYRGPYPCLGLRFPHLSNAPVFYFLLDTGANVNSIRLDIVQKYHVPIFAKASELKVQGTSGMGGAFDPGDIYNLGNCQIHGLPPQDPPVTFLTNLTVAALPHASPVSDGLLGWTFFHMFSGGVEWDWYGTDGDPPTVQFFFTNQSEIVQNTLSGMHRLPISTVGPTLLPMMEIRIINPTQDPKTTTTDANTTTSLWALIDTGAPITVISRRAAALVGIEPVQPSTTSQPKQPLPKTSSTSPGTRMGDVLTVGGVDGRTMQIVRSAHSVHIEGATTSQNNGTVDFGEGYIYIGDLPGLAVMEMLSPNVNRTSGPDGVLSIVPSVVLGLDFLLRTYRMLLRLSDQEVWFENMPSSFIKTFRTG